MTTPTGPRAAMSFDGLDTLDLSVAFEQGWVDPAELTEVVAASADRYDTGALHWPDCYRLSELEDSHQQVTLDLPVSVAVALTSSTTSTCECMTSLDQRTPRELCLASYAGGLQLLLDRSRGRVRRHDEWVTLLLAVARTVTALRTGRSAATIDRVAAGLLVKAKRLLEKGPDVTAELREPFLEAVRAAATRRDGVDAGVLADLDAADPYDSVVSHSVWVATAVLTRFSAVVASQAALTVQVERDGTPTKAEFVVRVPREIVVGRMMAGGSVVSDDPHTVPNP